MRGMGELAKMRIVQRQRVDFVLEEPEFLPGAMLIAMPEQPFDAREGVQQALGGGFVMMDDTSDPLRCFRPQFVSPSNPGKGESRARVPWNLVG